MAKAFILMNKTEEHPKETWAEHPQGQFHLNEHCVHIKVHHDVFLQLHPLLDSHGKEK